MCRLIEAAEYLLTESVRITGKPVINNQMLQKLLYIAQGCAFATDGEELFTEDFVAWQCGPALPDIDVVYRVNLISPIHPVCEPPITDRDKRILQNVLRGWIQHDSNIREVREKLVNFTKNSSPWEQTYESDGQGNGKVIEKVQIKEWYMSLNKETIFPAQSPCCCVG